MKQLHPGTEALFVYLETVVIPYYGEIGLIDLEGTLVLQVLLAATHASYTGNISDKVQKC